MNMLRECLDLNNEKERRIEQAVRNGRQVDYNARLASLFLQEIEQTVYQKIIVDYLCVSEVEEVRLATQNPWFMDVALRHRVWFPDGSLAHGLRPSRWVAFYETAESLTNPSAISFIARNRIFWNRITLGDALAEPELSHLFADRKTRDEVQSWYKDPRKTFHMVLTDPPVKLRSPIPLAKSKRGARFLAKKIVQIDKLINASSVDMLFEK